jgi:hypothetical protein
LFEAPTVIESPTGHTRIALSLSCATDEFEEAEDEDEDSDNEIDDEESELNDEDIADDEDTVVEEIAGDEDVTDDEAKDDESIDEATNDEEIVDELELELFADEFPLPPPHPVTIKQIARLALHTKLFVIGFKKSIMTSL